MPKPWSKRGAFASPEDKTECRSMIRTGSRSFYTASLLLPTAYRDPAYALYAFCRLSDDAVDECDACLEAVALLRRRLDLVYAGTPMDSPVDRAFADTVERFAMPRALPEALLEGFEWDARERRYETISDVRAYGARVAGAVGAMMSVLMEARQPEVLARACDLGVAMQLSNIARDVGEDARNGRLYLPRQWMRGRRAGPGCVSGRPPALPPPWRRVVSRLLDEAAPAVWPRRLRHRRPARRLPPGDPRRPPDLLPPSAMMWPASGFDSVTRRAHVSARRKIALLGQATRDAVTYRKVDPSPAVPETHYLVEAADHRSRTCGRASAGSASTAPPPRPRKATVIVWPGRSKSAPSLNSAGGPSASIQTKDAVSVIFPDQRCTKANKLCSDVGRHAGMTPVARPVSGVH